MLTQQATRYVLSRHAQARTRERGLTVQDVETVLEWGEGVTDGYVVTGDAIRDCRNAGSPLLRRLERLRGVALIMAGPVIVTAYRADRRRLRRLRAGHVKPAQPGAVRPTDLH